MNGLSITRDEFGRLPQKDKWIVVFDNLEYIRTNVSKMRTHRKISYYWLTALTLVMGTLLGVR